jgi:hypothetical protein
MARTKKGARKDGNEAPRKQNRPAPCKNEIAWRKNKAMELYPDFKPELGFKKIGRILGYVSIFSTILNHTNIIKRSHIINLFLVSGSGRKAILCE